MKKYLLIIFTVFSLFFISDNVHAANETSIYMNNKNYLFTSNNFHIAYQGQQKFILELFGSTISDKYFVFVMCTDSQTITSWNAPSGLNEFNIYNTKYSCMFPNSSYSGGHVAYIYGSTNFNNGNNCSVSGDNCLLEGTVTYQEPNQSSWALLSSSLSSSPFTIDYASDSLMNQNQTVIDQNNYIINQNNNIYDNISNQGQNIMNNQDKNQQQTNSRLDDLNNKQNQTNSKLDDVNNSLKDDSAPDVDNTFSDIKLNTNSAISNLVLMPINYLNRILTLSNDTCSTYSIDFGIFNSNYKLNLPCIKLESFFGNYWWNVIDYFICFFMIYNIIMLAISAFEDLTSLRDSYDSLYQPKHSDTGYQPKHGGD